MKAFYFYDYPAQAIGRLGIGEEDGALVQVFKAEPEDLPLSGFFLRETKLLKETDRQLREYFSGQRKEFTLPLLLRGTDFQKRCGRRCAKFRLGKRPVIRRLPSGSKVPKPAGRSDRPIITIQSVLSYPAIG